MEWSKLYANLTSDVRVQAAEADAKAGFLLIDSICYVTLAESQGFIPDTQVPRFGGPNLAGRVKALVGNELWLKVDGGYLLNPDIWNEERNLSDSAEKKRKADRERMRAKRADAREAGTSVASASRDSRATGRATSSSDKSGDGVARLSRTEQNREEQPPLTPPHEGGKSRCARHKSRRKAWCDDCKLPALAPVPDWCGACRENTRRVEGPDGEDLGQCQVCHPSVRSA